MEDLGLRIYGSEAWIWSLQLRVYALEQGLGFGFAGSGLRGRLEDLGLKVPKLGVCTIEAVKKLRAKSGSNCLGTTGAHRPYYGHCNCLMTMIASTM